MSTALKLAVIGSGYFSQFHCDAWNRLQDTGQVDVIGLYTLDADSGRALQSRFGIPVLFDSLEALIEAKPDLVDIIAPPAAHAELIDTLAAAGIDCICQKPFCDSLLQAQAVVKQAESRQTRVFIHENFRHQPWYRYLKQELPRIGEPYQISFRMRPGDGQGPEAYLARQPYFQQQQRFLVQETAVHWIDVFRFLFGEVEAVFADLARLNPAINGEDAGILLFRFANGTRGMFDGNRLSDHASSNPRLTMGEMLIEGSTGQFGLNGQGDVHFRAHGAAHATPLPFEWDDHGFGGDCVYLTQKHIVDHVRNGSSSEIENTARDYLANRVIEECVYRSSAEGCWMPIPAALLTPTDIGQ